MPRMRFFGKGEEAKAGREVGLDRYAPVHVAHGDWTVSLLAGGMTSGATSIMLLIPANIDGEPRVICAETSVNSWMQASSLIAAACADEIERPGWAKLSPAARQVLGGRYAEALRRSIPSATGEQIEQAVGMMLDSLASGDDSDVPGPKP